MKLSLVYILLFVGILSVSACSVTYDSKYECESDLASDRGAVVGAVMGSHIGDGTGQAAVSAAGGVIGSAVGRSTYDPDGEDDYRPYRRSRVLGVFTGCVLD